MLARIRRLSPVVPVFAAVFVSISSASATGGDLAQTPALDAANRLDFRQVIQSAKTGVFPAVVYIKCVREDNTSGEKKGQEVSGSGVLITPEGQILTNWHVIDKAQSVRCLMSDGRHYDAKVLGSDKDTDLAVIQLDRGQETDSLPFASLGDSDALREGDFVMAMGAPWGLNRSVSIGIVSCTNRYLEEISEYSLWIQTDAAINPGNSGGPLVNTQGEIVGINARGMSFGADGMGFAIPSSTIRILVEQIRRDGKVNWSWTGLQLQPLRDFNKDTYFEGDEGVIVAETDPESPARRAGFEARDRITAINGTPITAETAEALPAVRRYIGLLPKEMPATFTVIRAGETRELQLTPREKGKVEGEELACKRWDLTFKAINQFDNKDLYFYRKQGVFVHATRYPGNAANAGLRSNDIIVRIDGEEITSLDQAKAVHERCLAKVDEKPRVVFTIMRGGLTRQIVVDATRDFERE